MTKADARARIASVLLGLEREELGRLVPLLEAIVLVELGASQAPPAVVADLARRDREGTLLPSIDDPRASGCLQELVRALGDREERTGRRADVEPPKSAVRGGPLARARLNGDGE